MQYLVTAQEMKKCDRNTIKCFGMDSMVLMERAALAAAASIPTTGLASGGQQVPQLDGRSGPIAQGAVANADGTTNYGF